MILVINTKIFMQQLANEQDELRRMEIFGNIQRKLGLRSVTTISQALGMVSFKSEPNYILAGLDKLVELKIWTTLYHFFEEAQIFLGKTKVNFGVFLMDKNSNCVELMTGVTAHTINKNSILFYIYPWADNLSEKLKCVCFHEYAHVYRNTHIFPKVRNLLEMLVDEGIAESVVKEALGSDQVGIWAKQDVSTQEIEMYIRNLYSTEPNILISLMFGNKQLNIKDWLGYSVGYQLVQEYIADNNIDSIKSIIHLPSNIFIPDLYM